MFKTIYATITISVLTLIAISFVYLQRQEIKELNQEISSLKRTLLTQTSNKIETSTCTVQNQVIPQEAVQQTAVAKITSSDSNNVLKKEESSEKNIQEATTEASFRLARIETLITLTDEQKNKLLERYKNEELNGESQNSSLEEILGEESYRKYQEERLKFREQMRKERYEAELFGLSRKLSLTNEQESKVAEILLAGREQFFPLSYDPEKEEGKNDRFLRMRERMQREQQRQEYNAEALKSVLNEEQYNQYLRLQAESPASRSHLSALQALPSPNETGK